MVYVRLAQGWTDGGGADHVAGDMVDVDAVTLARLEAEGVVATTDKVDDDGIGMAAWPGLTTPRPDNGGQAAAWPGLTTPRPNDNGSRKDDNGDRKPEKAEDAPTPDGDGDGDDAWPGLT
jgi:hypothetical protein